jgi:hypothetical protein
MSISETANESKDMLSRVAQHLQGTPAGDALGGLVRGAERFKASTGLGADATKGRIGDVYKKIASANGIDGLIANASNRDMANGKLDPSAVELLSLLLAVLIYVFIGGVLEVGLARVFLETRRNPDTRLGRLFFIFRIGGTRRVALIVFLRAVYLVLWAFTIVGLPIKYYAYRLVPYLVAENPEITHREVFARSAELMRGHKMRMFLFDLSFVPLYLLALLTFGIVKYVWFDPYYNAAKAEIYVAIRGDALSLSEIEFRPLPERFRGLLSHVGAKPQYSYINLAFMFLIFSFVGWIYECSLWLISDGIFINRGTMYGPWIPIYGIGGLAIITIVNRFYRKPILCFFMIIAVCAPIEYVGAWILWQTRHLKYWDYSGYFLNLQGRICLESMISFAILGTIGIYVLAPVIDSLVNRVSMKTRKTVCVALYTVFFIDVICAHIWPRTGKGITDDLE